MSALQGVFFTILVVEGAFYILAIVQAWRHRAGQEGMIRLFCLYAIISFILIILQVLYQTGFLEEFNNTINKNIQQTGMLILATVLMLLVCSFLRRPIVNIWFWIGIFWLVAWILLSTNVLPVPKLLWINDRINLPGSRLPFGILLLGWINMMMVTILVAQVGFRRTTQILHRNRTSYLVPVFILLVVNDGLIISGISDLFGILRLLAVGIFTYIVVQHRLPDARAILRQALSPYLQPPF